MEKRDYFVIFNFGLESAENHKRIVALFSLVHNNIVA